MLFKAAINPFFKKITEKFREDIISKLKLSSVFKDFERLHEESNAGNDANGIEENKLPLKFTKFISHMYLNTYLIMYKFQEQYSYF